MTDQKIIPSLWFDKNCEEAMNFYTSLFPDSKIVSIKRYEEGMQTPGIEQMVGKVLTGIFELSGYRFMALDGGPIFKINPSISFHVKCKTKDEVDNLFGKLSDGGKVLMELSEYPFSERYAWVEDKFGVSWQLIYVGEHEIKQKITPILLFVGDVAGKAEEAINFYTSVFHNAKIEMTQRYGKDDKPDKEGTVKYAHFMLEGQEFGAMDSAHEHKFSFNEAISFLVNCEDQKEIDKFWEALSAVSKSEICGWLKDKYGVSWQIIPKVMGELLSDPNKEKANRVMNAMLKMKKIIVADLEKAYEGK